MKKVLGIVAIASFAFSFASCKKEYDCTCTGLSLTSYDKVAKGKNATDACTDAEDKLLGVPIEDCVPK